MSPYLIQPAQSEEQLNKMSVAQLEQFVSFIVKRSCGSGAADGSDVATRPNWWPRDVAFSYPISRCRTTDPAKWRQTLLDVVASCYTYRNRGDFGHTDRKIRSSVARRNGRRRPDECKTTPNGCSDNAPHAVHHPVNSPNSTPSGLSPVVSLCDVLKVQARERSAEVDPVNKTDFLNYFKLSDTHNCSVILSNNAYKPPSHPIHLINSQHVPFSSDLGKKMTKDCHIVPLETHQRKIERVERYLTTIINSDTAKAQEYEISFNKPSQYSHTYVFPNKIFRRKERLSSKASFLLMHHCKPCLVQLVNLKIPTPKPETKSLPLNVPTDAQKENLGAHLRQPKQEVNTSTLPKIFTSKTTTPSENTCIRDKNVLQTLVPQNDNVKNTFNPKSVGRNKNILNASVLLTPLNGFFGLQRAKSATSKSTKKKKGTPSEKLNRVQKRRMLIYHPRRFSLRVLQLKYITNNK